MRLTTALLALLTWLPTPTAAGDISAGVLYQNGKLSVPTATNSYSRLDATYAFNPTGMNPVPVDSKEWWLLVATNRTQGGAEVVIGYHRDEPAHLWIYDWSYSPPLYVLDEPILGSWVESYLRTNLGWGSPGHSVEAALTFQNETKLLDASTTPDTWRNRITLWNPTTQQWDVVYQRTYTMDMIDCSQGFYTCAYWGPALETYETTPTSPPVQSINEIGAWSAVLRIFDGATGKATSYLMPTNKTILRNPLLPYTILQPNWQWGLGQP